MTITVHYTKSAGLDETFAASWDDSDMDRFLAWAKLAYPAADGSPANDTAACRRAFKSWCDGMKDAIRKKERDDDVAELPVPPPITGVVP